MVRLVSISASIYLTFLTAFAAVIAVASIIADEVAPPRGAVAVLLAWAIGASMQIIAGITARLRAAE